MTVEEMIAKLQPFPPHYEVNAAVVHDEADDETADIVDVQNIIETKIVNLVLDGRPARQ